MRSPTLVATALTIAAALIAAVQTRAEITVGFQTSLSGPIASVGIPLAKGIAAGHTYISEINGHKIRLIQMDDASDPSTAARNARKLVDEYKVDVLMGSAGSPLALATAGISLEQKVPMVVLAPVSVPGSRGEWLIVVPHPVPLMVAGDIEHMKAAGVKTVAYIGFNDAWGDLVYDSLVKTAAPAGIQVVANERYGRADMTVTAQVLKIIAIHPDAIVTGGAGTPGVLPHRALKERGFRGAIYSTHAIIGPEFPRIGGPDVDGVIAPTGPSIVVDQLPESNPIRAVGLNYRAVFQKVHGEPATDNNAAYAYDGWLVMADAAKRALARAKPGTSEYRTALRDALVATDKEVVGTQAIYNYRPGERYGSDERSRVMVQLQNGQWKLLQ